MLPRSRGEGGMQVKLVSLTHCAMLQEDRDQRSFEKDQKWADQVGPQDL